MLETILQKMNGDYEDKFSQAKAMYLYMMVHPGKKLNFMCNEIGQFREWDYNEEGAKNCKLLLYSDWERCGGATAENAKICEMSDMKLNCTLEPFSAMLILVL